MVIPLSLCGPLTPACEWARLDPEAKRERVLEVASAMFSAHGLETSMPAIAAEVGAGVASLYRQFPSKRELLAELIVRRLARISACADQAAGIDDAWGALKALLGELVEEQPRQTFFGEAWEEMSADPRVVRARSELNGSLERVLAKARAVRRIRADARAEDIILVLTATRAVRPLSPEAPGRILTLLLAGLEVPSGGA